MSMTWNSENHMTESVSQNIYSGAKTLTRYKYDHEGNRVVKSSNYGEVVTPSAEISYRNDSIVTKHIFVSGVRVASKVCDDKSSNTYYQSVDHLGSTNVLTDDKGEFYEHIETFPDGNIWVKEYVDQSGVNTVFTSHEMDVETKFFYAKARYYDAQLGRFISVDPIIGSYLPTGDRKRDANMPGYGGFYNPVNINMYSYGANNPLKFVDPDGKKFDLSSLNKKQLKLFNKAVKYFSQTSVGKKTYNKLKNSDKVFKVKMSEYSMETKYEPEKDGGEYFGTIYWDSKFALQKSSSGKILTPAVALAHEMGHAIQDLNGEFEFKRSPGLKSILSYLLKGAVGGLEGRNLKAVEKPIAKELNKLGYNEHVRESYSDWDTPGYVNEVNQPKSGFTSVLHYTLDKVKKK